MSSSVERRKRRPLGTRRIVTGIFSSLATRRIRFFMMVGLVPSGSDKRVAVLKSN
jgi:hypothetical protein